MPFPICLDSPLRALRAHWPSDPLEGHGFHAACPPSEFTALRRVLGARAELFASPLNCYFPRYCSAFADTDRWFGSLGSFFEWDGAATVVCARIFVRKAYYLPGYNVSPNAGACVSSPREGSTHCSAGTGSVGLCRGHLWSRCHVFVGGSSGIVFPRRGLKRRLEQLQKGTDYAMMGKSRKDGSGWLRKHREWIGRPGECGLLKV